MPLHPNIPRLYIIKISKWFMLYMPIVVLFYESNGLQMKDIMVLQAIYSIMIVILEIPSGYMADVWGRKKTILTGAVLGAAGFMIYGVSYGFMGFMVAQIILGIGQIIGCATLTMAWFAQKFFEFSGIDKIWFGLLWAALNITVSLSSFFAYRTEMLLGPRRTIILISLAIPLGYIGLSLSGLVPGLIILFLFYLVRGYATPVLKDYINRVTSSEIRATVLSVRNFFIRIIFSVAGPLIGWVNDVYDLPAALLLGGIIFLVLNVFAGILFLASRSYMNDPVNYISKIRTS